MNRSAKAQSTKAVTHKARAPPSLVPVDTTTDVVSAKVETGLIKGSENDEKETKSEAKIEVDISATAPSDESTVAAQVPEGKADLTNETIPLDSQMEVSSNETALIKSSESKIDIENKIDPQTENMTFVETKEQELGQSDMHPVTTKLLASIETCELAESTQMETTEQTEDIPMNVNEQSENLQMDTHEHVDHFQIGTNEHDENAAAKTTEHAEGSSFGKHHPLQPKDALKVDDMPAEQEEVEDTKPSDDCVAQNPSTGDTEPAVLTESDNVESTMEPVLEIEQQLPPIEESMQNSEVPQANLSPESTDKQDEVEFKDEQKVCEPVLTDTALPSSDQNQAEIATTQQQAPPIDDMTLGFPPVTQEILKALEAAVHQCRLQSSLKRAEEASIKTQGGKDSAEKDASQLDRKGVKTDKQKTEKGNQPQSTRTIRSQRRKTESPEREFFSRQRVKSSSKDGSPTTSNEGSSSSSNASRKTRPESSTVLKRSRDCEEEGYKVRVAKIKICFIYIFKVFLK